MRLHKFILLFIFYFLISTQCIFSQAKSISNFQAKQIGFNCENTKGSDLTIADFLISIDWDKGKIIINREETEEYYIKKIMGTEKNSNNPTTIYLCINLKNLKEYEIQFAANERKVIFKIQSKESRCYNVIICGYL